jgi:hypothetical protein
LLGPNTFLSIILSITLSLWASSNFRDQVSYPHKRSKFIVLHILTSNVFRQQSVKKKYYFEEKASSNSLNLFSPYFFVPELWFVGVFPKFELCYIFKDLINYIRFGILTYVPSTRKADTYFSQLRIHEQYNFCDFI